MLSLSDLLNRTHGVRRTDRVRDYLTGTLKLAQLTIQEDDTDDPL